MIILIVLIAACVIFLGYTIHKYGWEWSLFFFSFYVAFCGFLTGIMICLIASGIFSFQPIEDCRIEKREQI